MFSTNPKYDNEDDKDWDPGKAFVPIEEFVAAE